jgi:molybdate transport system substrate-binding protein
MDPRLSSIAKRILALGALIFMSVRAGSVEADPLRIYAAGSLTAAFTEMLKAFHTAPDGVAPPVFGPAGLLGRRIEGGAAADILALADMAQPERLARGRGRRPVVLFARNRMCALARRSLGLTPGTLLEAMLAPHVRLATSTPGADPGGDYAWAVFARAGAVRPGAQAILQAKARKLVGGPNTPPLVPGHGQVEGVFLADKADIVLGCCSGSPAVMRGVPGLVSVALPSELTVRPAYGMVVLSDKPEVDRFAVLVMSQRGQDILARNGFDPVALSGSPARR